MDTYWHSQSAMFMDIEMEVWTNVDYRNINSFKFGNPEKASDLII